MAKLSNINGKFAVEDTGAIRFSDQTGTTGQILKSNGNAAPTWVDPNTVGTGPWLPLAGGIVSGPTTFQSSLTVGGTLTRSSATFTGNVDSIDGNGYRLKNAANSANESGFIRSGLWKGNADRDPALFAETGLGLRFYTGGSANESLIIDSSGNATFAGNVNANERVIVSGNTNTYSTAPLVYFDSTSTANPGVRDWAIGPADDSYGNFHIFVGASTGADPVGNAGRVLTITNAGIATFIGRVVVDNLYSNTFVEAATLVYTSNGSEGAPSYTFSTDPNTGMYHPSADTICFSTGGSERMRITSGGIVQINTNTAKTNTSTVEFGSFGQSNEATNYSTLQMYTKGGASQADRSVVFQTIEAGVANAGNIVLQPSGGNVGIGTTSPLAKLETKAANTAATTDYATKVIKANAPLVGGYIGTKIISLLSGFDGAIHGVDFGYGYNGTGYNIMLSTNDNTIGDPIERMRITSGGYLLASNTGTYYGVTNLYHQLVQTTGDQWSTKISNDTALPYGLNIKYVNSSPNGANHQFLYCADSSAIRFYVNSNGGIGNFSSNNVNISDERVKNNIENSGDYLNKICSIPVRLFNYKDEPEGTDKNLGVIAQEVEAIAPELVNNDGFGETPEDGIKLKAVYSTDMMYALMKSIQELKAEIEILKNK